MEQAMAYVCCPAEESMFNGDALRHCLRLVLEIESFQIFAAVHKSMFKIWQQSYIFQN